MGLFHIKTYSRAIHLGLLSVITIASVSLFAFQYKRAGDLENQVSNLTKQDGDLQKELATTQDELKTLQSQDQYVVNKKLEDEISNINQTYQKAIGSYESLLDVKALNPKLDNKLDETLSLALSQLAKRDYKTAQTTLSDLDKKIQEEKDKLAPKVIANVPAANAPVNNTPPGSGYSLQRVQTDVGTFTVAIVAADMGSTRIIVDTASDGDCRDNCPVLSLAEYVSRNGAFAGVNGSYFCPATYPTCAGKTNSFDTLLMNKNKVYFNSDNNVYSTVPAAIFLSGSMRFVGQSLEWGRDTSPDGVIANYPLLVSGNNVVFGGSDDPKIGSKGGRSFVGNKGSTAYIGVVFSATVGEAAHALKALGLDNALNLDDGGSTALWHGGYKAGPGRGLPNAVLFVGK